MGGRPGALGGRALLMARQFLQTGYLVVLAGSGRVSLQEGQTKVLKGRGLGLGGAWYVRSMYRLARSLAARHLAQ